MEPRRVAVGGRVILLAACVLAIVANVVAHTMWNSVEPYVGFSEHAIFAAVGIAYALLGGVAGISAIPRVGAAALLAGFAQAAAPFALGLQQRTPLWVVIGAFAGLVGAAAVWLVLSSPVGRLSGVTARLAVGVAVSVAIIGGAATVLTYDPSSWGWCECAPNPLALAADSGAALTVRTATAVAWGVVGVATAVAAAIALRRRRQGAAGALAAAAGIALAAAWITGAVIAVTTVAGRSSAVALAEQAALLAVAVTATARIIVRRASRGRVADLLVSVRDGMDPVAFEHQLARALGDPELTVVWWGDGAFRERDGAEVADPTTTLGDDRAVLVVEADGRPIAVVVHDHALDADPGLLAAVAQALRMWSENARLTEELGDSLRQTHESRARIVSATDEARRRIERDLHDGAQQLLVSAGVSLSAASARAGDDPELTLLLAETSDKLDRALAELRELASGIAPIALAHGTLADALRELALRSVVPTTVHVEGTGDPPDPVRSTLYFVVAESLANIAKHTDAASARVALSLGETTGVTIVDDGCGGADPAAGTGLRGLADRVEALGGRLDIQSGPAGTTIAALVSSEARS